MERFIVDRFEGDIAVLEAADASFLDVPATELPEGVKRGDSLVREEGAWRVDAETTEGRWKRLEELRRSLTR